jgi:hypothetical protein
MNKHETTNKDVIYKIQVYYNKVTKFFYIFIFFNLLIIIIK